MKPSENLPNQPSTFLIQGLEEGGNE